MLKAASANRRSLGRRQRGTQSCIEGELSSYRSIKVMDRFYHTDVETRLEHRADEEKGAMSMLAEGLNVIKRIDSKQNIMKQDSSVEKKEQSKRVVCEEKENSYWNVAEKDSMLRLIHNKVEQNAGKTYFEKLDRLNKRGLKKRCHDLKSATDIKQAEMQSVISNLERERAFDRDHFTGIVESYEMRLGGRIELEAFLFATLQENERLKNGFNKSFEEETQFIAHAQNQTFSRAIQLRDQLQLKSEELEQLKHHATENELKLMVANQKLTLENEQLRLKLAESLGSQTKVVVATQEQVEIVGSSSSRENHTSSSHESLVGICFAVKKNIQDEKQTKKKKNKKKNKRSRKRGHCNKNGASSSTTSSSSSTTSSSSSTTTSSSTSTSESVTGITSDSGLDETATHSLRDGKGQHPC